jgi:hypothetical protein
MSNRPVHVHTQKPTGALSKCLFLQYNQEAQASSASNDGALGNVRLGGSRGFTHLR